MQIIANADFSEFELQVGIISKSILMELKESNANFSTSNDFSGRYTLGHFRSK